MMFRNEFEAQCQSEHPGCVFAAFDAGLVHGIRCEEVLVYASEEDMEADEADGDNTRALGRRVVVPVE